MQRAPADFAPRENRPSRIFESRGHSATFCVRSPRNWTLRDDARRRRLRVIGIDSPPVLMVGLVADRLHLIPAGLNEPPAAEGRAKMTRWRLLIGLALPGAALVCLPADLPAATSSTLDILSNDRAGDTADGVDIGRVTPIARPNREAASPLPGGNPLWSIPLTGLTATQERPIFSASRRPPQRAVVAPAEQAAAPLPPAAEPERPMLALIGAVVGDGDAIAVFLDRTNQKIVRLRQGDTHSGWVLSSVQGREVTLKKSERSEVLVLQRQEAPTAGPTAPALPGPVIPAASNGTTSFAPFTPRSTPKNGESDGL
jgi:general secretion pathway protein N